MNPLVPWIWAAGGVHLLIIAANFFLPKRLQLKENLSRVSPVLRQVFLIHWLYILLVVGIFSGFCFFFASELAGGSRLGTFVSAVIALFWLLRVLLQLFYYDAGLRRQNRLLDAAYLVSLVFLTGVFGAAAIGGLR